MRIRLLVICMLAILNPLQGAYADLTVEVVPKRGIIILDSFSQWAGLLYQYSNHTTSSGNFQYTSHQLEELYHANLSGAIVDRHLLNFQLDGEVWFQQVRTSSDFEGATSASGAKYRYNLSGSAFDLRWHPITFHSSRELDTVVNPFTPVYTIDQSTNWIETDILKGPAPTKIRYERDTRDNSGSIGNSTTTSDSFSISSQHDYKGKMSTSLAASWDTTTSTATAVKQTSDSYVVDFGNVIFFGKKRNYSLSSSVEWQNQNNAGRPQENGLVREYFLGRLGKALNVDLSYLHTYNLTTSFVGQEQTSKSDSLAASISHRLFSSLDTRLRAQVEHSEIVNGSENNYAGSGMIAYRKNLSAGSFFNLTFFGEHGVTDRRSAPLSLNLVDERHQVDQPGQMITLTYAGALTPGSVQILGYSAPPPTTNFPPDLFFIEGFDYFVNYSNGQITWGSLVPPVPLVLISYSSLFNPSVKYATDTINVSSDVSFLSGRYTLSAAYLSQVQTLISGTAPNGLFDTTIKSLRFRGHTDNSLYELAYEDYVYGPTKYRFLEGLWQYTRQSPRSSLSLQARDRVTDFEGEGTLAKYTQNTLNATATYKLNMNSWSNATLMMSGIDSRGGRTASNGDFLYVRASFFAQINRLVFNLTGQSGWRFYTKSNTRDDFIRFQVTRYF